MSRSSFGFWGAELDDYRFRRALAALGLLVAHHRLSPPAGTPEAQRSTITTAFSAGEAAPWILFDEPAALMRYARPPDASQLAEVWSGALGWPHRLEIQPDTAGRSILPWIAEQLSQVADAVYVRLDRPRAEARWGWPLRVGVLNRTHARQLERALRQHSWGLRLCRVEPVGTGAGPFDILILPLPLRQGMSRLLRQAPRVRASLVLVLGGLDEPWQRADPLVQALLAQADASGLYLASRPVGQWASWFADFLRVLSHDQALDLAVHAVENQYPRSPSLLFASRQLIANSRVSVVAGDLVPRLIRLPEGTLISVPDNVEVWPRLEGIVEGQVPAHALAAWLQPGLEGLGYQHEGDSASYVATVSTQIADLEPPPPAGTPRWIQGQAYELRPEGEPRRVERALRAGARHLLVVRIGPEDREWLTPPREAVFPDDQLEWDVDQHELRVVFSEPNHVPEPQTATIQLPRTGASSTCQFPFQTRTDVPTFRGRVIVLHRNRVLQTALLEGQVLADPDRAPDGPPLALGIEAVVRPVLEGLGDRQEFDLAFVTNHSPDGEPGLTVVGDYLAKYCMPPGTEQTVGDILSLLKNLADAPELYPRDLKAGTNVKLLRDLAFYGSSLYDGLVDGGIDQAQLKSAGRIQVVATRGDYVPLEFVYELPAPKEDATLCPNAAQELEAGACAECTRMQVKPGEGAPYVCPLGFWCMRLVIESHWLKPGESSAAGAGNGGWGTTPLPGARDLPVLRSAVLAASSRVDEVEPGGVERVLQALQEATGQHTAQVADWDAWLAAIHDQSPSLLVLLPHMDKEGNPPWSRLAIGQGQASNEALVERYTDWQHVRASQKGDPPLMLLLGCETRPTDVHIGDFSRTFRRKGAAIVLSTLTPVLGRHVTPVAELLIQDLKAASAARKSFGYVLRDLRRQALVQGILMVLCLTALGDTDWRLV